MDHKVKYKKMITLILFFGLIAFSLPVLTTETRNVNFFEQALRLLKEFFPPDMSVLPDLFSALVETLRIAILSTLIAVGFSVVLSVGASRNTSPLPIRLVCQFILVCTRTVPSLILAVIAVALIGSSPKAGVLALTLYSIGYLGKFFMDILDQADPRPAQWLRSQKASSWQVFQYSLWPDLKSALFSNSLWMCEYNIRSASIIGYVGAGGIGLQLHVYQEFGQWRRFCSALLVILMIVISLEVISQIIKRKTHPVRS